MILFLDCIRFVCSSSKFQHHRFQKLSKLNPPEIKNPSIKTSPIPLQSPDRFAAPYFPHILFLPFYLFFLVVFFLFSITNVCKATGRLRPVLSRYSFRGSCVMNAESDRKTTTEMVIQNEKDEKAEVRGFKHLAMGNRAKSTRKSDFSDDKTKSRYYDQT